MARTRLENRSPQSSKRAYKRPNTFIRMGEIRPNKTVIYKACSARSSLKKSKSFAGRSILGSRNRSSW